MPYKILSIVTQILVISSVYVLGRYDFSFGWILPMIFSTIRHHSNRDREVQMEVARTAARMDERDVLLRSLGGDVPSWVLFPDVERAEWMNKLLKLFWPKIKVTVELLLKEAELEIENVDMMKGFKFSKFELGSITPRISGIKVHDQAYSPNDVIVDIDFLYMGDAEISFVWNGIEGGIKNLQFEGSLRIVLKLVSSISLIDEIHISFLKCPRFDYQLLTALAPLNMFAIGDFLRALINDQITNRMVFPKKIQVKLKEKIRKMAQNARVEKVVKFTVHSVSDIKEYEDLAAVVTVELGSQSVSSKNARVADGIVVMEFEGILLKIEGEDNFLEVIVSVDDVDLNLEVLKGTLDLPKADESSSFGRDFHVSPKGLVCMDATLMELSSKRRDLKNNSETPSALLEIFIESVQEIPHSHKALLAKLSINVQSKQTEVLDADKTSWKQFFTFFLADPAKDTLTIQVTDPMMSEDYGNFVYKISDLILRKNMEHAIQPFPLHHISARAEIIMSLSLKAMKTP